MNVKTKMRYILLVACIYLPVLNLCFCSDLFADEANRPKVKMLYIFISADVNEVLFDNIWSFERDTEGTQWETTIDLPAAAADINLKDPNKMELSANSKTILKKMNADSKIDSVGFSFTLPNNNGTCQTSLSGGYGIDSMDVYVSGPATKLFSSILKHDTFMTLRSRFSGVYTAQNLPAGTEVKIRLNDLPRKNGSSLKIACLAGLGLIIGAAFFTLYHNRKNNNN